MTKKYFNWKLAVVLILALAVLVVTAFGLRHWQRGRRATRGLVLGTKAYQQGNWQDAATYLGRYLSIVQDDIPVLLDYAEAQLNIRPLRSSNIQQSMTAYRTILRLMPGNEDVAVRLAEIYFSVDMQGEAEQVARRALQSTNSPIIRRMLAISLIGQRKFADAAVELENIIKTNPHDVYSYDVLGRLIEQRPEDFNIPPQFWFDEAVKNNNASAQAYVTRGAFYLRQGIKAQAMADFSQAIIQKSDDPNVMLQLADQLIVIGDLQQAQQQLEIVTTKEPSNQMLWHVWAKLAISLNSKEMMIKVADSGLKELALQPWDFMPFAAELYIRTGQLDKAENCISQLNQRDIVPSTTAFLDGLLAEAKGNGYRAINCWQKALDLGGEPAGLRIAIANTLSKLGDTQSAIKQLRIVTSEQPDLVTARLALAGLLADEGRWAESLEHASAAIKLEPKNSEAAIAFAIAQMRMWSIAGGDFGTQQGAYLKDYLDKLDDAAQGAIEVQLIELQLAVRRNDFAKVETLLNQLKRNYPSDDRVIFAEVDSLTAQQKTGQAIELLTKSIEKSPDSILLVQNLAGLLSMQNEKQKCQETVIQAMARTKNPSNKKQLGLLLAGIYADFNEHNKRYELLVRLAVEFPDDIPVLRAILSLPAVSKDTNKSQKLVNKIKSIEGDKGWQWRFEQARVWFVSDDFKANYPQLVSLLKETLLVDPDNQASRMLLAASYEKAGDMRLASATYDEAISRSPDDIRVVIAAVGALYEAKEYDRADQILRRAAEGNLEHPWLRRLQIQSCLRRGDLESAGAMLTDILAADPNNKSVALSLAVLKIQQRRLDDAENILNALIKGEPNSLPVTAAMVELNLRRGTEQKAIELCNGIVQRLNNASAMVIRGRTFAILKQVDKASADFEQAVLLEPKNIEALSAKSDFYRSLGEIKEAVIDIQLALDIAPDDIRLQKRAIPLFLAGDDLAKRREAAVLLESALQKSPLDIDLRLYKARLLLVEGTTPALEKARNILEAIAEQQPVSSEPWQLLAEVALRQGRSAEAIDIALRGLVYRPNEKSLLLLRARLEGARSPTLAIPTLRSLRENDPNGYDTAVYLAEAFIGAGEYKSAIALLESQLKIQNSETEQRQLKIALGEAFAKAGRQDESKKLFDDLRIQSPNEPDVLLAQIRLFKDDKVWNQIERMTSEWIVSHPEDLNVPLLIANDLVAARHTESLKVAERLYNNILKQDQDFYRATYSLAQLMQTTGRSEEAADLYRRIIAVDPNNVVAINNLAWIFCEEQGLYAQALELAENGLEKEPNYVDLLDTRGVTLYRLGQFQPAADDLIRCVNLYPANAPALAASQFHLGRTLEKLGRKQLAVDNIKKAIDLNGTVGGLTSSELIEARQLLERLSAGGN